ncbi:hypothetical protein D2E25_0598 [Bifidobacterium goeldii]|uniref:Cell division protein FtsK n=1 Tax=Bifidobacterium goeldii TaxID=2306975 RepID=A0A430FN82_9BIFI|nr:hypothetical protein [Bifidobacterium goeldii]RSX54290.1 hypothetical protein D2E25_0598 [Bifidobacterium goeldii]
MGLFDFLNGDTQGPQQPSNNPFAPQPPVYGSANTAPAPWQSTGSAPFGGQSSTPFGAASNTPIPHRSSSGAGPRFIKRATEEEIGNAWPAAIQRYQLQTVQGNSFVPQIDNSLVPRVTPEQRKKFSAIKHLPIHGRRIYGKPGSGLSDSDFGQEQVRSGTAGEQIFAKLLSRDGILDRCVSFWSMARPTEDGERDSSGADVDCALLIDNHLLLIDVKNYRAGLAYHTLIPDKAMFCVYPAARVVAQNPYIFSVNMNWARNNLNDYLGPRCPGLTIDTFVVLVPGESGEATLDPDITWPGGIPAYSYSAFKSIVNRMLPPNQGFVRRTPLEGFLASMVKHYTCSPISPTAPVNESAWPKPTFDDDRDIDQLNEGGSHGKSGSGKSSKNSGKGSSSKAGSRSSSERSSSSRSESKPRKSSSESSSSSSSGSSRSSASASASASATSTDDKPRTSSRSRTSSSTASDSSRSSASSNSQPFGSSHASSLPTGWGADDIDDDDDWVPPSKMPKPEPQAASRASGSARASASRSSSRSTAAHKDPFARPDGQSRTASSGSAKPKARAKAANPYSLDHEPPLDAATLSYECGLDPNMKPVSLSLSGVSGVVAAGTSGMGEVTGMMFMATLLAKRAGVFMRFIDCKDSAYLDTYQPAFATLIHRSQGLDALLKEVQDVKRLVDSRSFLVRRLQPNGDYWAMNAERRLKPLMLFIHECGSLFNLDSSSGSVSSEDREAIETIQQLLLQIIERGRQAGVIVVLSTQQPGQASLPKSLVDACQMRICFGAVDDTVASAIFSDRASTNGNPTTTLERSHAVISMPQNTIPDVRFYTIAKSVTEGLLGDTAKPQA